MKMRWARFGGVVLLLCFLALACGCRRDGSSPMGRRDGATTKSAARGGGASAAAPAGRAVVVWISVDGLRPDYVDRASTPTLHKLMREGAFSKELVPTVPSLTFPSHVSLATGVPVAGHGVPGNSFYDSADDKLYDYPALASLLQAEPIWLTAKRQGVRTLVHDWPLSQAQAGETRADYFLPTFDNAPTDAHRLQTLIDTWRNDAGAEPLRLIMGYVKGTDATGHTFGPDSREVEAKLAETDALLGKFLDDARAVFREKMSPADRLYILVTTDHGMARIRTIVNFKKLLSAPLPQEVRVLTGGGTAIVHLGKVPPDARAALKAQLLKDLARWDFAKAYEREALPPEWGMNHPTRVGEIVVMLKPGHAFNGRSPAATAPADKFPGVNRGAHGYIPAECPEMLGFLALWQHPEPAGAQDLGSMDALQIHPMVAKLLGVQPAEGAQKPAVEIRNPKREARDKSEITNWK